MKQKDVILIGYENQENLGLRSLISYLHAKKYTADLIPFHPDRKNEILKTLKKERPRIVGFSFIFQYTLNDFRDLIKYLRKNGIKSHFTAGGHFPSIETQLTFEIIPELNSIVRFEGELTLIDLIQSIDDEDKWYDIPGLAFKRNSEIKINNTRPLIKDLDNLPDLYRKEPFESVAEIKIAYMLASRGCLHNCSFCSIRQFYGNTNGPLRRTRSPKSVVAEMNNLYNNFGVRFFLFQDDDFANRSLKQKQWTRFFLEELEKEKLGKQIRWKISCRVDDIEPETLSLMKEQGLTIVYLGIESGNLKGLKTLQKGVTVEQNINAVRLLKSLDIGILIGFMLFDPSSTILTVRENLNFLKTIGSDGYFSINFCKMLPYAGTPIEKELKISNRLKGTVLQHDYDFLDPLLDFYFYLVQNIFTHRNFDDDGIINILTNTEFEYQLIRFFYPEFPIGDFKKTLSGLIAKSNLQAIETLEKVLDLVTSKDTSQLLEKSDELLELAKTEWEIEFEIEADLHDIKRKHLSGFKNIIL